MPRKTFVAGEILTAADVNSNLMDQAVMVFNDAAARDTAIPSPIEGMVVYLKDTDGLLSYSGTAWVPAASGATLGAGTILQAVFATDGTERTSTSTSFADAGVSVSVTPQRASSTLIVQWVGSVSTQRNSNGANDAIVQITDSSNVALSGAEEMTVVSKPTGIGQQIMFGVGVVVAVVSATDTSARTYKLRFRTVSSADSGNAIIRNATNTGRMTVLEVAG